MKKALLTAALASLALCSWAPAAVADESVNYSFAVPGSNGYRVLVLASNDGDNPGEVRQGVTVYAMQGWRRWAAYYAMGVVTPARLKADLGAFGKIDLRLAPGVRTRRAPVPAACGGGTYSYELTTYTGTFRFRGEGGYTIARASRLSNSTQVGTNLICRNFPRIEPAEAGSPGAALQLELRRGSGRMELFAAKNRPRGRAVVGFETLERRRKDFLVARGAFFVAGQTAFEYDSSLSTADLEPPAPFSGSATLVDANGPSPRLVGSLTVDLPGRPGLRVAGTVRRSSLEPATWILAPPEFR